MMPRFRALCLFATSGCATVMLLACLPASAQVVSVTVGGTSAPISPKSPNGTVSAGKGITIGGTFLKHNNPASVWSVSDANSNPVGNPRTATATEIKFLDPIWALSEAAGTAFANGNAANYLDSVDKIFKLAGSVAPDAGGKGNFPFINKPQGTILSADTRLQSNAAIEEARASPTQTQTAINPPTFQRQLLANVKVGNEKEPVALSTAIFKDPEEIQWGSVSTSFYPLQVSLAGLTLSTQSVPDGIGWAFDQTSGSYINDNTNLDAPESSATALYNLRVSEASVNGQTPTYSVLAATSGDGEAMWLRSSSPVLRDDHGQGSPCRDAPQLGYLRDLKRIHTTPAVRLLHQYG
jgi:hypothetical protein